MAEPEGYAYSSATAHYKPKLRSRPADGPRRAAARQSDEPYRPVSDQL